ncbi:MAG TPA: carboxypeptidase regulatory-like domain-containing protein [Tepidisphaeraceae bacterium]|nr:carboxypeptidase regulatory-like domain-containing protein [Tepidisphaeraceae bacterium]
MQPPPTGSEILDRAIESLRTPQDSRPPDLTIQRTVSALWSAELRRQRMRTRWVMGIAAAVVLAVCTSATLLVLQARHSMRTIVIAPPPTIPTPPPPTPGTHIPVQPTAPRPQKEQHTAAEDNAETTTVQPAAFTSEVRITGHVYYDGPPVERRPIDLSICPQCMRILPGPLYDDSLIVNQDGSLQNVIVSITNGLGPHEHYPPGDPVVLDQKYCTFEPHVVVAMVGSRMTVRNSDPLVHSTHAINSTSVPAFNFAMPGVTERTLDPFRNGDTFQVHCDLHPWMRAWVCVMPNPYYDLTRGAGTYTIRDLPPGTYQLTAWHEVLGTMHKEVTITGGEPAVVDFTFEGRQQDN